ncbi:RidA family protein [Salinicoccus albus]|uniref:RidA family protein n=1 Tax=Salinicoccus albus TaxID=418756 RepID=UPI0003653102|nr:RidA family protein [Salinicoccus albus]
MTEIIRGKLTPAGNYVLATRFDNIIHTSGITSEVNGKLIKTGKIMASNPLIGYKQVVQQATANALSAVEGQLADNEEIAQIININVYIQAEQRFNKHTELADFAMEYLVDALGDKGLASRTTIGVSSLPNEAPVEIQIIAGVK